MLKKIICLFMIFCITAPWASAQSSIGLADERRVSERDADRIKISMEIDNTSGEQDLNGVLMAACYQDGFLKSLCIGRDRTIKKGIKENAVMTIPIPQGTGTCSVRAYFWDGCSTMKPLNHDRLEVETQMKPAYEPPEEEQVLYDEMKACFQYLWNEANTDPASSGYGIVKDYLNLENPEEGNDYGSIAAVGFALAAIPVGVENGWITEEEGYERAVGTLMTFRDHVRNVKGFFHHFLNLQTGQPYNDQVEISTIDTALFLAGGLVCAEYFAGEAKEIFNQLYSRVDWQFMMRRNEDEKNGLFYMAAKEHNDPDSGEQYIERFGWWDTPAEQFVIYVLAAGTPNPDFRVEGDAFYRIDRIQKQYGQYQFIPSWSNSLFHYQFSHAFIDFRGTRDKEEIDWFENAKTAVQANRQYCIDNPEHSQTYHENSWGLTACYTYEGYRGSIAAAPSAYIDLEQKIYGQNNGTIPLYGAAGSIVYLPEEVIDTLNYYRTFEEDGEYKLWDARYGFIESYNLERFIPSQRFIRRVYGLNKGITCLQLANYLDGTVWEYFMQNSFVKEGLKAIGISEGGLVL